MFELFPQSTTTRNGVLRKLVSGSPPWLGGAVYLALGIGAICPATPRVQNEMPIARTWEAL